MSDMQSCPGTTEVAASVARQCVASNGRNGPIPDDHPCRVSLSSVQVQRINSISLGRHRIVLVLKERAAQDEQPVGSGAIDEVAALRHWTVVARRQEEILPPRSRSGPGRPKSVSAACPVCLVALRCGRVVRPSCGLDADTCPRLKLAAGSTRSRLIHGKFRAETMAM